MKLCLKKRLLVAFLILTFLLPFLKILAQEPICDTKEECQELLKQYEAKIAEHEKDIAKTGQEKETLQNHIYLLRKNIDKLNLQIHQSGLMINDLSLQIDDTGLSIEKTSSEIEYSTERLANILRTIYEIDQKSLLEILLTEEEFSDFFDDLMALENLSSKNRELLLQIKELKSNLEGQKLSLSEEKGDTERVAKIQALQRQESAEAKEEQEYFLKLTESEYQKYLSEKQEAEKTAAEIRHRLFELVGVPKGGIEFGQAVEIAKYVKNTTGVRAAFLLALLAQESSEKIGANVGQCYLKDSKTGDGVSIRTGKTVSRAMCPSWSICHREPDVPHFLNIIQELRNAGKLDSGFYDTPISCPMSFGWGGAMGPAQFIPSTWRLYKGKIERITGDIPANPWNIRDSFLAAGLYLGELGATSQTYQAELNAALRYFGCTSSWCVTNYGTPVMLRAARYEREIKILE